MQRGTVRCALVGALILLAIGCDVPVRAPVAAASASAPAVVASTSAAPVVAPEVVEPGGWRSFDAVPAGALFRLGSRAWMGGGELAVSDAGTIATENPWLGLVEIRADGLYRSVPTKCLPRAMRYAGEVLLVACDGLLMRWDGVTATTLPTSCDGGAVAFSPRKERLACSVSGEAGDSIHVYDTASSKLMGSALAKDVLELAVSDAGVVFAQTDDSLVALVEGKRSWNVKGDLQAPAYEPTHDEVVVWNETDGRFDVLRGKDGKRVRRTPKASHSLRGPIAILPDGGSWLAVAEGTPAGLMRWNAKDGRVLASWPTGAYASGAVVSDSGRFAAALDEHLLRVDLSSGAASPKIAHPASEPASITSSRSGDRVVVIHKDEELLLFDARTAKELVRGEAPDAISRDVPVAYSPDGASLVLANAYGDLRILDATTLRERCRNDEVGATWLFWSGKHIVAVYLGNPADDEQYLGGEVMVLDASCKLEKKLEHEGLITVADDDGRSLDLLFEAYEAPPWGEKVTVPTASLRTRAMRVDHMSGGIGPAPASVLEKALAERKAWESQSSDERAIERVTSANGATTASAVTREDVRTVTCRDAKSNDKLAEHTLPRSAWWGLTIADDGSWFAVPDGPTVLVYPCRKAPGTTPDKPSDTAR